MIYAVFAAVTAKAQTDKWFQRIVDTSTEVTLLKCIEIDGVDVSNTAAADCSFGGSVNSGSGIGVAIRFTYANRPVRNVRISRAGIYFDYPGGTMTHSEISGACWSATYTATVDFEDGTTCTVVSTGSPPHSACTETAIGNSSAPVSAATFSEQVAPGTIMAVFANKITAQTANAQSLPLPESLGGVEAYVFLNTPRQQKIGLFYVSPGQVNALLPADMVSGGLATLQLVNLAEDSLRPGFFSSNKIEPGIFTRDSNGHGVAAGYYDRGYYVLFGTGFNGATTGFLFIGGARHPAAYIGPTGDHLAGLTQINILAPTVPRGSQVQICAGPTDRCSAFFLLP